MIPFTQGLVSHFMLNEPASDQALDMHGGNHLSCVNNVGAAPGLLNGARSFSRINDQYFQGGGAPWDITGTQDFFFSLWFKPASLNPPVNFFGLWDDVGYLYPLQLTYDSGNSRMILSLDSDNYACFLSGIQDGVWQHIVGWRRAITDTIGLRLNDSVEVVATMPGTQSVPAPAGAPFFWLGKAVGLNSFDGLMDEFSFWKGQTKTPIAATNLYNGGTPLPYSQYGSKGFDF